MYDIVVVGAGPSGIAAAKRCAENGFDTLLLEKFQMPRRKVCDGTMAPGAQALVKQEYGDIPESVRCDPPSVKGLVFYTPTPVPYHYVSPWVWRKNLDHWMCKIAKDKGVEVWELALFTGLRKTRKGYTLYIEHEGAKKRVETRYVVGADGAVSRVRRSIFPNKEFTFLQQGHERYVGELDLDRDWYHEFLHPEADGMGLYSVYNKEDKFVIGYAAIMGRLDELIAESHVYLQQYGFDPTLEPVWSGRCFEPIFPDLLGSRKFRPAKDDVLLVGDAGGLMMPISMEGIGPGISSGLKAANAIARAAKTNKPAGELYLEELEPMIDLFDKADKYERKVIEARESDDNETWVKLLQEAENEDFYNDY